MGLRRAVVVDEGTSRQPREEGRHGGGHPQLLAGRGDLLEAGRQIDRRGRLGQQLERHERQEQPLDPLLFDQPPEPRTVGAPRFRQEDQGAAGAQGVGRACTEAFVSSFVIILVMNFFLAMLLNTLYQIFWPGGASVFG